MTIHVYRLYRTEIAPENYVISVISTENGAQYVYPTDSTDDYGDRIEAMAEAAERDGTLPKTPEEWVDLSMYNLGLGIQKDLVREIPEGYDSEELFEQEEQEISNLDAVVIPDKIKARGF